jgi:uncharacterized membrane protein YraQ (UPF0718 family)
MDLDTRPSRLPRLPVLLLAVALSLGISLAYLPPQAVTWVGQRLPTFATVFLSLFIEAVPFLLMGTLASGLVEVFLDRDDLGRWLPRDAFRSALMGCCLGLIFPVCECGVVPLTRRLLSKGMPLPTGIAFILAAPVLNPIVIASTLAAFGPGKVFWGRLGMTLIVALAVGLVFSIHPRPGELLKIAPGEQSVRPPEPFQRPPVREGLHRVAVIASDEFFEMGRYLILGGLLAALLQTLLPQAALLRLGRGPVLSVMLLIALAVLLSVCSTVDAFIALTFAGTFTTGSILAFLVFGPMIDIKSTLMLLSLFRKRPVAYIILLPLAMIVVMAVFLNLFIA